LVNVAALRPALLGDAMLLEADTWGSPESGVWAQAFLGGRWADDDAGRWAPLEEGSSTINEGTADMRRAERQRAVLLSRALAAVACSKDPLDRRDLQLWVLGSGQSALLQHPRVIADAITASRDLSALDVEHAAGLEGSNRRQLASLVRLRMAYLEHGLGGLAAALSRELRVGLALGKGPTRTIVTHAWGIATGRVKAPSGHTVVLADTVKGNIE
jgi:hypothetical protein